MTGIDISSFGSIANSVYFAFFAFFGCSIAITCLWFILERVKERHKKQKENNNGS